MQPPPGRRGLFFALAAILLLVDVAVATHGEKVAKLIGVGECADCGSFKGVHVAVVCENGNKKYVTEAMGEFTEDGGFNLPLPTPLLEEDGSALKKQCFAQLFTTSKHAPCPTQQHLGNLRLVHSSNDKSVDHVFHTAIGKLSFSHAACSDAKYPLSHPKIGFSHHRRRRWIKKPSHKFKHPHWPFLPRREPKPNPIPHVLPVIPPPLPIYTPKRPNPAYGTHIPTPKLPSPRKPIYSSHSAPPNPQTPVYSLGTPKSKPPSPRKPKYAPHSPPSTPQSPIDTPKRKPPSPKKPKHSPHTPLPKRSPPTYSPRTPKHEPPSPKKPKYRPHTLLPKQSPPTYSPRTPKH